MEGRALRGAWGGWGRIAPEVGTTLPPEPGLITPGASLARGDQEQSQRQTAPRSHPSGASQLSPFCEGAPGALAKFGSWIADSGAQRISLLLTPCSCG